MTPVLECALANAALAVPLAVLAAAGSLARRPAVAHALWLVVLLRLFTPPFWRVPLPDWSTDRPPITPAVVPVAAVTTDVVPLPAADEWAAAPPDDPAIARPTENGVPWLAVAVGVWLAGTAVCLGLAVSRGVAFHRLVGRAESAPPAGQQTCDRLARRMGLRRGPDVRLVRGPVSPLLWAGFGRPRLILPADLASHLGGAQRAALLAHELAHLRRGDHLVRWLELAATATYWWHPVVWWARRGLRAAEEQCCDAWVVWALPAARRAYADALVDTVEFLSCARPSLPPLASGLGEVGHLRRRVVMIMRGGVPHRLSRFGLCVGLAAGLAVLSVAPGRGQDEDEKQPEPRPREVRRDERPRQDQQRAEEVEHLRRAIREMREHLMAAERRLAELEGRPVPPLPPLPPQPPGDFPGGRGGRMTRREGPPATPERRDRPDQPTIQPPPPPAPEPPAPPTAPRAAGGGGFGGFGGGRAEPGAADRRMRDLERELADLRREIAELRREMRRPEPRPSQP